MNYKLLKKENNNKSSMFIYEIIDETGKIITTRKSNREYVAATIDGRFFFGRIDLIGKGDHGRTVKWLKEQNREIPAIAYK